MVYLSLQLNINYTRNVVSTFFIYSFAFWQPYYGKGAKSVVLTKMCDLRY